MTFMIFLSPRNLDFKKSKRFEFPFLYLTTVRVLFGVLNEILRQKCLRECFEFLRYDVFLYPVEIGQRTEI